MTVEDQVRDVLQQSHGAEAWQQISQSILTPAIDFNVHREAYAQCYGDDALTSGEAGPAWLPTPEVIANANVTQAGLKVGCSDYTAFHQWSIANRELYWDLVLRRLQIVLQNPAEQIVDATSPTRPIWLPGAAMNIVESCLQGVPNSPAIISSNGNDAPTIMTVGELRRLSARVANALAGQGIALGDAVAIVMPMTAEAVAIYLGIITAGASVVSIPDSFAAAEIATRLRIASAKLVLTQDCVLRNGKRLPLYDRVMAAEAPATIVLQSDANIAVELRSEDTLWTDFLSADENLAPVMRSPQDTINILFSSGTTGDPKAIPWDHTTPIKCAADAHFHQDIHCGDVLCWPTSLGWMMGPWLIFAALINRATIALYEQSPIEAGFGRFVQDAHVTMLGLVPSMVRAWRETHAMEGLDWSSIRAFSSSGECSNASDMFYLMHLAGYRPVIEYCGGTEIGGAYITSTVVQPNIPGTFTTPTLGLDFVLLDEEQNPQKMGEVFLHGPSMGLSTRLLNRDHDAVYFEDAPIAADGFPLRRHGDEVKSLSDGGFKIVGRCDDTMNLGGIKVGCAEIERVLNLIDGVSETAAVAVSDASGGPSRLVVFTVPKSDTLFDEASLKTLMQKAIREKLNPLFRVDEVRLVTLLPRTASNKIMRRELRALYK